jgi:hypothetical protein
MRRPGFLLLAWLAGCGPTDRPPDVAATAAAALGAIGPGALEDVIPLGEPGRVVPVLVATLRGSDSGEQHGALEALESWGRRAKEAVPAIAPFLKHGTTGIRRAAAAALRSMGPDALPALDELVAALRDGDPRVRASAAHAVGGIGPEASAAESHLLNLFKDSDANVQNAARMALQAVRKGR